MKTPNTQKKWAMTRDEWFEKSNEIWSTYYDIKKSYEEKLKSLKNSTDYAKKDEKIVSTVKYLKDQLQTIKEEFTSLEDQLGKEFYKEKKGEKIFNRLKNQDEREAKTIFGKFKNFLDKLYGLKKEIDTGQKIQNDNKKFMNLIPGYRDK